MYGNGRLELGELSQYLCEHSDVPGDMDEIFVVHHQIFYEDDAELYSDEDDFQPGDVFRFYLSTLRLIGFSL
jgi:hypothetical protein